MFIKALSFSILIASIWCVAVKLLQGVLFELFEPLLRTLTQI